jgi:hypothetical protein
MRGNPGEQADVIQERTAEAGGGIGVALRDMADDFA